MTDHLSTELLYLRHLWPAPDGWWNERAGPLLTLCDVPQNSWGDEPEKYLVPTHHDKHYGSKKEAQRWLTFWVMEHSALLRFIVRDSAPPKSIKRRVKTCLPQHIQYAAGSFLASLRKQKKMGGSKSAVIELADAGNLANQMRRRKKNVGQENFAASPQLFKSGFPSRWEGSSCKPDLRFSFSVIFNCLNPPSLGRSGVCLSVKVPNLLEINDYLLEAVLSL
ncbi:hypothetical protein HPG69_010067 [Diceros bicornis minor]|uniref:Uncharacterized protein n=1 Tax=Diceros bicornis minor TaxID=77932 RepID=A0A7J7EQP8_DICBM|nr:hypothetical protein HPG69_010067 [Diceros bicornis minor]